MTSILFESILWVWLPLLIACMVVGNTVVYVKRKIETMTI